MMDMNIALTGHGQLEVVAKIYEAVKSAMPGYFSLPDVRDFDAINKAHANPDAQPNITLLLRSKGEDMRIHFGSDDANIIVSAGDAASLKEARNALLSALSKDNALLVIVPVNGAGFNERSFMELGKDYRGKVCIAVANSADKVLRYAMAFMSGELAGELRNFADRFSYGIANDEGVLCGHELLTPPEHKPEAKPKPQHKTSGTGKIIAAFIAGCVIGCAGGYFVGRTGTKEVEVVEVVRNAPENDGIRQELQAEAERLRASIQSAIQERDKAQTEAASLRTEKDKAMEMANRYKQQADTLTADNKKLQSEVQRLKDKDKKSIRLPNPFK